MSLNVSLRTRLTISVLLLLTSMIVLILFVIQSQEVEAIFNEQKKRALLLARSIALENLQPFVLWDYEAVKANIEKRIDEKLIYVIFYNRYNQPFEANDFILGYEDIYRFSSLDSEAREEDFFFQSRELMDEENNSSLDVLEVEIPVFATDSPVRWGSVKIGLSMEDMQAEIRKTRLLLISIGCGGVLFGLFGTTLLAKRITGPLKKLVEGTVKVSHGDFSLKIDISSRDEIGDLARSFNEMSRQLDLFQKRMEAANKKLIQVEKLASIGHISAGIAHEIRNPLTSVKLNIQKLLESSSLRSAERDHLDITQEGIAQIEKFIKELLNFARVAQLNLALFSVEQIIEGAIKMTADFLELKRISLEKRYAESLPQVTVDADKIRQVILNVLRNACEAVEEGGKIAISVSVDHGQAEKGVKVEISDNGRGIPKSDWEDVFEPFYTTKAAGIGLGLAIARKIMEQHNGSIKVKSKKGRGTTFEIYIPCQGQQ